MISENNFKLKKDGTPNYRCFCRNPELSAYNKAHPEWQAEHNRKIAKEKVVGTKWYNNGVICIRRKEGEQPDGFVLGRI